MKKFITICAVVIFALALPAGAATINYTVSGWGPNQYPASTTPPAGAPWGVDGYPGDTLEMVTYTGTLDLAPGTYYLKINTLKWTIDYTYGGTETQWDYPDHWSDLSFNTNAARGMSIGTAANSLSQACLLEVTWFNDYLSFGSGSTTSFTVQGYRIDVTPLGLSRVAGSNFSGSNPWVQPEQDVIARFDVVPEPCPEPLVGDLDGDCRVNFIDFAMMAENWLKSNLVSHEASLDNLQWSVQYMIDTSQTDFGQIQSPGPRDNRGLAISPDGRYLYAGYNNGPAVRRIDLTVSDYIDAADAQVTGVRGKSIDVDDAGRVYLAEGTSIKVYNADLSSNVFNLTGLTNSEGVAVTRESGQLVLYNSDRTNGTLKKWLLIESGGSITSATLDTTFGTGGTVTLVGDLRGVEVDPDGRIWTVSLANDTVYRISSDGLTVDLLTVNSPIDIDFVAGTALVSRYTDRVISRFDMNTMLSAGADIAVPWTALELDPDGQSSGGALSGIIVSGNGLFVANETGQTADEKSTYGRTDGNSGYIGDKFYTDLYNDDNDPILFAAAITCSGPLVGDLDGDCRVNLVDLEKMAENWLRCDLQPQSSCP